MNKSLAVSKNQALEKITQDDMLREVYSLEPFTLDYMVDLALSCNPDKRWQAYEQIKGFASGIVGFNARHDELATCTHYEIVIEFIDWLLPNEDLARLAMFGGED
jgi:hypothetical protein